MKTIKMKHQVGDDFDALMEELEQFDASVEWKEGPEAVLKQVDELLKKFGLEIVVPDDTGSDMVFFGIQKRPACEACCRNVKLNADGLCTKCAAAARKAIGRRGK